MCQNESSILGEYSFPQGLSELSDDHRSRQFWSPELGNNHCSTWQMGESTDGLLVFIFIVWSSVFLWLSSSSPADRRWFGYIRKLQASFRSSPSTIPSCCFNHFNFHRDIFKSLNALVRSDCRYRNIGQKFLKGLLHVKSGNNPPFFWF